MALYSLFELKVPTNLVTQIYCGKVARHIELACDSMKLFYTIVGNSQKYIYIVNFYFVFLTGICVLGHLVCAYNCDTRCSHKPLLVT